ncbi:alpha/beta hydrolase [Oricola thermophila]|uniref:Alpha/beta hydrolase n=1 Tax=Oricola thermophila TaxID=2742145 RepID=A0A6N1VDN5_9HYPH|nr:alpha/beta hydrolase [Oricola thermophila]QKV18828.1 alpha/beta hydrolase [Oricola thermophila]
MEFSQRQLHVSATGAELCLRHEPAVGEARGAVHILHGLAEHGERYASFARTLSEAGFHVYAHDHRGHGYTVAPGAPAGVFDTGGHGVEVVLNDVASVQDKIAAEHPDLPLVLFGHSMGGIIAMTYCLRFPDRLSAAAIWNANLTTEPLFHAGKLVIAWERFRLGSDVPSVLMPKLTFGAWAKAVKNRRTEFDWLSRDPAIVDAYIADPLCGWPASVGMWADLFRLVSAGTDVASASDAARRLPYNLVGGGADPSTAFGKNVKAQAERMRKAGFSDVTLEIHPDFRHETLNEMGREVAVEALLGWLRAKLPARAA